MNYNIIKIESILGTDIRVRSRIFEITTLMKNDLNYVLDFKGVVFISRSFADELISMMEQLSEHIKIINVDGDVAAMLAIVEKGRHLKHKSIRNNKILALADMNAVESFFNN